MSLPIVSAIVAHKFVAAILVASLVTSGGVVAVASDANHISNVVGELSFTINPSYVNVTSLASLNLGTLDSGSDRYPVINSHSQCHRYWELWNRTGQHRNSQ